MHTGFVYRSTGVHLSTQIHAFAVTWERDQNRYLPKPIAIKSKTLPDDRDPDILINRSRT